MRLVKRFKAGDELAFNRLFRLWQGDVYAYARAALGGHERAEDARQDVFLNILESIADFEPDCESAFRRWLFTIARNRVINIKEQEGRLRFLPVEEMDKLREHLADPDANVDHVLDWIKDEELFTLFERLPVAQRQALTLRCCEDLAPEEVATIMQRSVADVYQLHSRGARQLKQTLGKLGERRLRRQRRSAVLRRMRPLPVLGARRFALEGLSRPPGTSRLAGVDRYSPSYRAYASTRRW